LNIEHIFEEVTQTDSIRYIVLTYLLLSGFDRFDIKLFKLDSFPHANKSVPMFLVYIGQATRAINAFESLGYCLLQLLYCLQSHIVSHLSVVCFALPELLLNKDGR
jgi:hypothetical protein